jgi:hypothetical protein
MALDIEKNISQLVQNQFPEFYREEGEMFILFVRAYYEWLESNNQALYHSRRLGQYKDIDTTIEDFIIDFKNKYLSNVQFNTATNKKLFIKNALEFYRAKGTERAVDLFFKLVYGIEADVYYPGDDLFKLSDNSWQDRVYLELIPNDNNVEFVGKQIEGASSGAAAFAENLVKVKKGAYNVDVLYLAGVNGNFETGEQIKVESLSGEENYRNQIIGSLTRFDVNSSQAGFKIGETVKVINGRGKNAEGVVTETRDATGIVNFDIPTGKQGWGYGPDSLVLGSDRVLVTGDIVFTNDDYFYHLDPFKKFDLVKQDLITLTIDGSNTNSTDIAELTVGQDIYATANDEVDGTVVFEGTIVEKSQINDQIIVNFTASSYTNTSSGTIEADDGRAIHGSEILTFWANNTSGNNIGIDLEANSTFDAIVDATISGNVIGVSNTYTIEYTASTDYPIAAGDVLYQEEPNAFQRYAQVVVANTFANAVSAQSYLNVDRSYGFFRTNRPFKRLSDGVQFPMVSISNVSIGIIDAGVTLSSGTPFKKQANTYAANTELGTYFAGGANNSSTTYSTKASFSGVEANRDNLVDLFFYESLNVDDEPLKISSANLELNIEDTDLFDAAAPTQSDFPFIAGGNTIIANTTLLEDALSYSNTAVSVGGLESIVVNNPGEGYGGDPIFTVFEPRSYHLERYDYYIRYVEEAALKNFSVGEIITVNGKEAEARICDINFDERELICQRLNLTNELSDGNTANGYESNLFTDEDFRHGDTITGQTTGVSAVIEEVNERRTHPRTGLNAVINSVALSGTGFATSIRVLNSGFGYFGRRFSSSTSSYIPGEPLTLQSLTDSSKTILTYGFLEQQGIAPGQHPSRKSFLSSDKYLPDNDYYQEYSYKVLTALPFSAYKNTLVELLHLAGSRPFGGYVGTSETTINITADADNSEWDIKNFELFINQNTFYSANVA